MRANGEQGLSKAVFLHAAITQTPPEEELQQEEGDEPHRWDPLAEFPGAVNQRGSSPPPEGAPPSLALPAGGAARLPQ